MSLNFSDVGYNGISPTVGFINNVLNTYFQLYFPRAVQLSQQLRHDQYEETFIYTTHPWLVSLYLDCPSLILNNITLAVSSVDASDECCKHCGKLSEYLC